MIPRDSFCMIDPSTLVRLGHPASLTIAQDSAPQALPVGLHIVIATHNRHKVRELTTLLNVPGIRWHALTEFPRVKSVPERGRTFEANAITKARAVTRAVGMLALADDSGIEVDALDGAPGVRSARFTGMHGDDEANNRKLLQLLKQVPTARRGARYVCVLALASPTRLIQTTQGTWRGKIATQPKGSGGFGYDPIFVVPAYGKTVGQLSSLVKRLHSHRAKAAHRMQAGLKRLVKVRAY